MNQGLTDEAWGYSTTLLKFDQSEFIEYGWGSSGLRSKGWLFYPDICATTQCNLVVWLHGGGAFAPYYLQYPENGFGSIAAANNIIILFPQGDMYYGPTNCFDLVNPGYTGTDNWSHDGVQVKSIMKMV